MSNDTVPYKFLDQCLMQLEFDTGQFWLVFSRKINPLKAECSPKAPHQMG